MLKLPRVVRLSGSTQKHTLYEIVIEERRMQNHPNCDTSENLSLTALVLGSLGNSQLGWGQWVSRFLNTEDYIGT